MLNGTRNIIRTDSKIKWVLLAGLAVQILTSITAIGVSSADQHFQIVEFSLHQLGKPSGAGYVWEFDHFVRPTLQVYLFSGFHLLCNALGIADPYLQLTILRVVLGLVMFVVFNLLVFHYFGHQPRKILFYVLLLMNLSWALPYTRTVFSSEMVSSLFFFGTLLLYDSKKDQSRGYLLPLVTGFLFSLAFYFRFQIGFAMAGFGIWLLFVEKKYTHILPMAAGFLAGVLINVYLDYHFYKELVFTPYAYFHANINEGRATSFGTSSFLRYIALILGVMPAPLFSIVFFYYALKTSFRNFYHPVFLSVWLFIIAHSVVGHKEERFMYPIFNALPLIAGWSIPSLERYYLGAKAWIRATLRGLLISTIVINAIFLIAIAFIPYSQTIQFSKMLHDRFDNRPVTIDCIGQNPFETPNGSLMAFYRIGAENILINERPKDSVDFSSLRTRYLAASYNDIKQHKQSLVNQGYRPVEFSSRLLWRINEFLDEKGMVTINEIWALYEKKDPR